MPTTQMSIFMLSVNCGGLFEDAFSLWVSLKDGHYKMGLLWKDDKYSLSHNRQLAVQWPQNLEKKTS